MLNFCRYYQVHEIFKILVHFTDVKQSPRRVEWTISFCIYWNRKSIVPTATTPKYSTQTYNTETDDNLAAINVTGFNRFIGPQPPPSDNQISGSQANYSKTCIKRSHLRERKGGLIRQVTFYKRFKSHEIFNGRKRRLPLNRGDKMDRFDCINK